MKKWFAYIISIIILGLFNLLLPNNSIAGGGPCTCTCTNTYGTFDNAMCTAPAVVVGGACYNGDNTNIGLCATGGCLSGSCADQEFLSFVATNDTILYNIDTTGGGTMAADPDVMLLTYGSGGCPATGNTTCPGGGGTACIVVCNSGFGTFTYTGLTVGWTYYIIVESDDQQPCGGCGPCPTTSGTYTLCLAEPHCNNGVQDADETGVDCGGADCIACHCLNGFQDADETGVDCGGADCNPCLSCTDNEDCGTAAPLTLTGTDTLSVCFTDCNTGASTQSWIFAGGGCPNTTNAETVYYTFTTTNFYTDIFFTSADITEPQILVFDGCGGGYFACAVGTGGSVSITQLGIASGTNIVIMVTSQSGDNGLFNMCVYNYPDPSACAVDDTLIATPPPDTSGGQFPGVYPPNTTVEFCYTLTTYDQAACNYLHGIVPIIGSGWLPFDYTTDVTVWPATAGGNYMGSPVGVWTWFADGVVLDNGSGAPVGAGWFFLTSYQSHGGDPNQSYGDSNFPNCDATQGPWTVCFVLTTPDSCDPGADLSAGIKTYADGQTGFWNEVTCEVDPIAYPAGPTPVSICSRCGIDTIITTNVLCFGDSTGSAAVTMDTTGIPPYSYLWSNGDTNVTAAGLPAGTYTVVVTDSAGCVDSATITITQPLLLVTAISDTTNVACFGDSTGSATVTPTGGTTPYTYLWDDLGAQTDSTATGLPADTFMVIVTDSNGCIDSAFIIITQPDSALALSITDSTNVLCNGDSTGSATVTPSGGTVPYTYLWSDGQTDSTATGLLAGTYTVIVTDLNGCIDSAIVTITQPPTALSVSITAFVNVACNGDSTGSATVTPSGGTSPYTYLWSNGQTDSMATGLPAGTYTVIVTDSNGCIDSASITITQPTLLVAGITDSTNISCTGQCNGIAIVTPAGGTSPYTYLWSNGQTDSTAAGLCAGTTDTVVVTDANLCTDTTLVTLSEPIILTSSITDSTNITCNGLCNGIAIVTPGDGTSPYTYLWSNGQTDSTVTGLCAGTIDTVVVTDANLCTDTTIVTLSEPLPLTSSITDTTNVLCNGNSTGSATVTPADGTAPYTYLWSNGQTDSTATGLPAGLHTVTVTDTNSCVIVDSVTITQPPALALITANTNATCGNNDGTAWVTVTGGISPYTYSWNDSSSQITDTAFNLYSGSYTITVTDSNGCIDSAVAAVSDLGAPAIVIDSTNNISCNGGFDGAIYISASGGTLPYSYLWSIGDTTEDIDTLTAATYNVTLTDSNGCNAVESIILSQPADILLTMIVDSNVTCNGGADGGATVTLSGGTSPYDYSWSSGDSTLGTADTFNSVSGLAAGTYTVVVTDTNGCIDSILVTITEPLVITTSTSASICQGDSMLLPGGSYAAIAGVYIDTLTTLTGCDSVIATTISVDSIYNIPASAAICQGDSIQLPGGSWVTTAGIYNDTLTTIAGCDSVITTTVTVDSVYFIAASASICQGDSIQLPGGSWATTAGIYNDTLTTIAGCDSVIATTISVDSIYNIAASASICQGDSIQLPDSSWVTSAGVYNDTLTTIAGCDSVITTTVTVDSVYFIAASVSICQGDSIQLPDSSWVTSAGVYNDTLTTIAGCDSVITTTVTVDSVYFIAASVSICQGDSIQLPDSSWVTSAGIYYDTLTSVAGCDSVITTTLSVDSILTSSDSASICQNDSLQLPGGSWVTSAGIYYDTLTSAAGCDSVITTTISVDSIYNITVSASVCQGDSIQLPDSSWVTSAGIYNDTLTTIAGCDSVITMTVTVDSGYFITASASICQGDSVQLPGGSWVTSAGIYSDTLLATITGCDSVIETTLSVDSIYNIYDSVSICQGDSIQLPNGSWVTLQGTYYDTLTPVTGCDTIIATTLTVNSSPLVSITASTNVLCNGGSTGSATATPGGGTYGWFDGSGSPIGQTGSTATGLTAGNYQVTVYDLNSCIDIDSVTISEPTALSLTTSFTKESGPNCADGSANVQVSGGTPFSGGPP
ncbi:MAG: hypothetical protein FVQ78_09800, partial [Solirubrobacterales bacterium]|nr:hypothetical protein [Solirubrobacterales bacterium]